MNAASPNGRKSTILELNDRLREKDGIRMQACTHTHSQTSFYLFKEVSFMNKNRPPKHMYINPRKRKKEAKKKKKKKTEKKEGQILRQWTFIHNERSVKALKMNTPGVSKVFCFC